MGAALDLGFLDARGRTSIVEEGRVRAPAAAGGLAIARAVAHRRGGRSVNERVNAITRRAVRVAMEIPNTSRSITDATIQMSPDEKYLCAYGPPDVCDVLVLGPIHPESALISS